MDQYSLALRNINKMVGKTILDIFSAADAEVAKTIAKYKLKYPNTYAEGLFYKRNQALAEEIGILTKQLQLELDKTITAGVEKSWNLAYAKNEAMIKSYLSGVNIPASVKASFMKVNTNALVAFVKRTRDGITLSDRIWKVAWGNQQNIERLLASGITTGRSASQISRDIREFMVNPNKLFHRVRDKDGKLKLSKPALNYHPGAGVYRSSYKNAMRLARSENMIAFHTADYTRLKELPFVRGIEVHLSGSHPEFDICDSMAGEYPKEFMFTGWHPQCLCYTTTKLASEKEFIEYINTGSMPESVEYITSIPDKAAQYLVLNKRKLLSMKNPLYFIEDNFTSGLKFRSPKITQILQTPEDLVKEKKLWEKLDAEDKIANKLKEEKAAAKLLKYEEERKKLEEAEKIANKLKEEKKYTKFLKRIIDEEERALKLEKVNFFENVTEEEITAIRNWTYGERRINFTEIKGYLTAKNKNDLKSWISMMENQGYTKEEINFIKTTATTLDNLFYKYYDGAKDQKLFRGIAKFKDEAVAKLMEYKKGDEIYVGTSLQSWSTDRNVASGFAHGGYTGNRIIYELSEGRVATQELFIQRYSSYTKNVQQEVLMRTKRFRVVGVEKKIDMNGYTEVIVKIEEIK